MIWSKLSLRQPVTHFIISTQSRTESKIMKAHLQKLIVILMFQMALLPAVAATADKEISVDAILDKYIKAIGGKEAWHKVKSRTVKAEVELFGATGQLTLQAKAPNKRFSHLALGQVGLFINGFDGSTAWAKDPRGLRSKTGSDLNRDKIESELYLEIRMKELYPNLSFKGTETMDGEEVHTLESKTSVPSVETFSFSTKTGLLFKTRVEYTDSDGNELQMDSKFSDYRTVDGIHYPHAQHTKVTPRGQPSFEMGLKIKEIKHNEKIEDSVFSKPTE